MSLVHCPIKSRNKKNQTKARVPRWIQYFKYQQRKLHEILSFLYQVQPGPEFRTLNPAMPPGISSGGSGTDPIDDGFTKYNKTNTKRVYGDVKWPEHLADGFLDHAHKLKHNVFDLPWKQLM